MAIRIFISFILLLNHTVICFHTVENNFQRLRYQAIHSIDAWEEQIREEAVDILLPVFFPNNISDDDNPITAEKSLKKCLRRRYQKLEPHQSHNKTANESRGRLAALAIGTSIMRLRYWYDVVSQNNLQQLPIPYPLDSKTIDSLELSTDSSNNTNSIKERELVRCMIDEHANYLTSTSTSDYIPLQNCDKAIQISVQYSIPTFLTSLLIKQYTYNQVEQICIQMNNPGPITLRRNTIQFPGSDEDLCQYLLDEDGINARVCRRPHEDYQNNKLVITANSNNRYVMGSSSNNGYIKPPKGALKLLPQQSNETTAIEQRRNQKSIWSMKSWINGYFEVQDMGSQIIVQSLELTGGETVLDYCSGNGGKTFAAASALMNDNNRAPQHSKIVAHDVVEERLRQIKGSMTRVGFQKVNEKSNESIFSASNGDSKCTIQLCTPLDLDTSSCFDAVLVDAPCSSSGVLRRRPSQRWGLTENQVCEVLPNLQLDILLKAVSFVNENGGRLVYSTCSLLEEENESVVKQFEQSSVYLTEGFKPWDFDISNTSSEDREETDKVSNNMQHTITLLPSDESDGFFVARWKRVL